MKSYIKVYGPPVVKAIKALEQIAITMPEVCIMSTLIETGTDWSSMDENLTQRAEMAASYFANTNIDVERCGNIISMSGEKVGEYDFYFEWFKDPSQMELHGLIEKIDNALAPLGCKYTITTK